VQFFARVLLRTAARACYNLPVIRGNLMRILLAVAFLLTLSGAAYAQDAGAMPGYLVLREGDALAPLKFKKTSMYFEWENNDYAYASDWPEEGAFLVLLPEEQERVRLREENLFGDPQKGFGGELAVKDGNNDGIINADELVWPNLALWSDKNGDGYAQSSDLEKLSGDPKAQIDRNKAQLVFKDKIYNFHAFLPTYDVINSRYVGDYKLDIATLFLPTLRGYGTVPDLHIAASKDASLKEAVVKLCSKPVREIFSGAYIQRLDTGDFADIMYKWGGVDTIDPASRGPHFDARKLAILEKILGEKFSGYKNKTGPERTSDPNNVAARTLQEAWTKLAGRSYSVFMSQCMGRQLFVPAMQYDFVRDRIDVNPRMATLQTRANIDAVLAQMNDFEKQTFWLAFEDFLTSLDPVNPEDALELIKALKGPPSMLTEKKPIPIPTKPDSRATILP